MECSGTANLCHGNLRKSKRQRGPRQTPSRLIFGITSQIIRCRGNTIKHQEDSSVPMVEYSTWIKITINRLKRKVSLFFLRKNLLQMTGILEDTCYTS